MWFFRSVDGLWSLCEHDRQFVLMFNGECLGAGPTPGHVLRQVARNRVERPICGIDPATAGLPRRIENWSVEARQGLCAREREVA